MASITDETKILLDKELAKNKIAQQVSVEISKNTPLKNKLDNILEILELSYGLKHSLLLFPNHEQTHLIVFASRGFSEEGIGVEVPFGMGIVGLVAKKRKKIRISGIQNYTQYVHAAINISGSTLNNTAEAGNTPGTLLPGLINAEAQLAFPLMANDELIGVLSIESDEKDFFSKDDEHFLLALSQQMALSIQNALIINNLEQKVHERTLEIEEQNLQLENLNATKDKFFSIIGHDLKSPVSSLKVATELIQHYSKKGDIAKLSEVGFKINTAVNNVNQLLDNLVNWAMSQRNLLECKPEYISVLEVANKVEEIFKESLIAKSITLDKQVTNDCLIWADENMALTVFRNVLSNAIKFSNTKELISISSYCTTSEMHITITDNGVGIPTQKLKKLFELKDNKSTLGTNREKGTGLGMVLVKDFMELNKGTVAIESKPSHGTSVTLTFPVKKT